MLSFRPFFLCSVLGGLPLVLSAQEKLPQEEKTLAEQRRLFQNQELITAKPLTRVFTPGEPPRIIWRDVDEVRRLGGTGKPTVRWFDADLKETAVPDHSGRWAALVEDQAPNGTPARRLLTFFGRPPNFLAYLKPSLRLDPLPGPIAPEVWKEHQAEIDRWHARQLVFWNDTEEGAVLLAGLVEANPLGRAPKPEETALAQNQDFQIALRLKVDGLADQVRELKPPRLLENPSPVLREGSLAEAGLRPDAKTRIDEVLEAWGTDSPEPFVTLVARRGIIVTHKAVGHDEEGLPIDLNYKAGIASLTKTTTALLFSQFLEQGLLSLDEPISRVFPHYPKDSPRVPTFRQCLTHMSGFTGHGDWGGAGNPLLDNILLNGIDANEPGKALVYSGMGFDMTALAMQLRTGKGFTRLYHEHLFGPLEMTGASISDASAGAEFTVMDLAKIGQWLVNRGSYGAQQFISPENFEKIMPEDLAKRYRGATREVEGIGMHWMYDRKPGAPEGSKKPTDLIFSPNTVGHGSFSSCVLRADLDNELVVVQIRRKGGDRFGEWLTKLLQAIAEEMVE